MDPAPGLELLLVLIAFRDRPKAADAAEGLALIERIAGREIDPAELRAALANLLAAGLIHDPVRLEDGALQCYWRLEVTPAGAKAAQG